MAHVIFMNNIKSVLSLLCYGTPLGISNGVLILMLKLLCLLSTSLPCLPEDFSERYRC